MGNKTDRIIDLTRNKTKKTSIMINEELWDLFKQACKENNTTPTLKIEKWMITQKEDKTLSNCTACHKKAELGIYGKKSIDIPNYGAWRD